MEPEVTYTLPSEPEPVKPKRSRQPKPVEGPTEADFAVVAGGPQWARGTFVKNGVVLRFDESGYAATDRATAEAVVSQHKEFRIV